MLDRYNYSHSSSSVHNNIIIKNDKAPEYTQLYSEMMDKALASIIDKGIMNVLGMRMSYGISDRNFNRYLNLYLKTERKTYTFDIEFDGHSADQMVEIIAKNLTSVIIEEILRSEDAHVLFDIFRKGY